MSIVFNILKQIVTLRYYAFSVTAYVHDFLELVFNDLNINCIIYLRSSHFILVLNTSFLHGSSLVLHKFTTSLPRCLENFRISFFSVLFPNWMVLKHYWGYIHDLWDNNSHKLAILHLLSCYCTNYNHTVTCPLQWHYQRSSDGQQLVWGAQHHAKLELVVKHVLIFNSNFQILVSISNPNISWDFRSKIVLII